MFLLNDIQLIRVEEVNKIETKLVEECSTINVNTPLESEKSRSLLLLWMTLLFQRLIQ